MAPRGRGGGFRGRGSRGSGGRGRGRGRGRGSRYGPTRRFDGERLADQDEVDDSEPESSSDEAQQEEEDSASSEDEESSARPYMALLQSLHDSSAPKAKRRKLQHTSPPRAVKPGSSPDRGEEKSQDEKSEDEPEDVDKVDEEEGLDEQEQDDSEHGDEQSSDSEHEDVSADPFDTHIAHPDAASVAKAVKAVQSGQWTTKRALVQSYRATLMSPGPESSCEIPSTPIQVDQVKLKQKLRQTAEKEMGSLDASQRALMPLLFDYRDVLHCDRTTANAQGLRRLVCLHAVNHTLKTRDRIIKNNAKLAKEGEDADLELRDQGFTRPKVLFLLPTRNSCAQMVNIIRNLCEPEQQENRKHFEDSYVESESNISDNRPADFRDLFGGNDDDMFRIGVKFTRKTIKYFAQFYNSDILFASPLGLRMAMGSEEDKKKPDYDFLSSIELVIVDQADALLMQNWEHVEHIFEHLNKQPKDAHGCDFSRVREWYLDDMARFYRQTVVLSAFNTPELSELMRLHSHNWAGRARLQPEYPGVIQQLGIKVKQVFSRFQSSSVDSEPDARFDYFVSAIVPTLVKRARDSTGTLLLVPSYLDFVRVRNYFANSADVSSITFGAISEYTEVSEASRARSHFLSGRHRLLLYTERAHHFRRYQISGVHKVLFYGLPDNPIFYREVAGGYLARSEQDLRIEPGQGTVRVMFSRYDVMKLERVVGSKRVGKMMQERGDTFEFL